MAIALVQHTNFNQASAVASQALAYGSNVTVNDLLVVVVRTGGAPTSVTITDSQGNSYTNGTLQSVGSFGTLQISWAVAKSTGANTVTVTPSSSVTIRMAIYEYSGTATSSPLDAQNNTQTGTSTSPAATSITPAANNELVIGAVAQNTGGSTNTAGANFTIEDSPGPAKLTVEDWIQTTATATTAPMTLSVSDTWMAAIAVFKAAAGGGGSTGYRGMPVFWQG